MLNPALADAIQKLEGKDLFLYPEPEVLDHTNPARPAKLVLLAQGIRVEVPFPAEQKKLNEFLGLLLEAFSLPTRLVIGWEIKNFLSYVFCRTGKKFALEGTLLDLKVLESFMGISNECPKTFHDAKTRLAFVATQPTWKELKEIYKKVYLPLIVEVVPAMEARYMTHQRDRILISSYYEVVGQINGRMKCHKALAHCFNPHSITEDDKNNLVSTRYDNRFLYLDFKHMEASVLHWLTNDPVLGGILASGKDLYASIWKKITTLDADAAQRQKCKDVFLPVVFGLGVSSLAEKLKVSEATASKLVDRTYQIFSVAMDWIKRRQNSLDENNYSYDYFGKRRRFEDQLYRIRNFQVQSPAALICLHKLVRLHEALARDEGKLAYHVHDGYMLFTDKSSWMKTAELAKQVLESEEDLYPGLRLKVACSTGDRMGSMKSI